eukprot:sb/3471240/
MKSNYNLSISVRILNTTRCSVITSVMEPATPYCDDFMDQTNCSDPDRGVLRCNVGGYPTTISKYIICSPYVDVVLCDGGEDGMCMSPSRNCRLHKHLTCDGVADCEDASDEALCGGETDVLTWRNIYYNCFLCTWGLPPKICVITVLDSYISQSSAINSFTFVVDESLKYHSFLVPRNLIFPLQLNN